MKIGGMRLALDCLPNPGVSPTTSTTLPLEASSLTGDWVFAEESVTHDCPPDVAALIGHLDGVYEVRLNQVGATLTGCADRHFPYYEGGTVSAGGFSLDSGECCGLARDETRVDYGRHLEGVLGIDRDRVAVTERWDFTTFEVGPGSPVCSRYATGTLTRASTACIETVDCIVSDACARCVDGACARIPDCRYNSPR